MQEVLGVDIGGVIIDRANDTKDTSFFRDRYLESTAVVGAFDTLTYLASQRFEGRVHLVSKCGPRTEQRTREWLEHHAFYDRCGIPRDHVHFCRERRDKAPICASLGATHFIDDKLEVLGYLDVPHKILFNPVEREVRRFHQHLAGVNRATTWDDVRIIIGGKR